MTDIYAVASSSLKMRPTLQLWLEIFQPFYVVPSLLFSKWHEEISRESDFQW